MIAVTGANGHLGRLVVEGLAERVPAGQIVAAVRSPQKASSFRTLGVQVREADYARPETLRAAFAGVKRVLLISAADVEQRFTLHKAVIDTAKQAGVEAVCVYEPASRRQLGDFSRSRTQANGRLPSGVRLDVRDPARWLVLRKSHGHSWERRPARRTHRKFQGRAIRVGIAG